MIEINLIEKSKLGTLDCIEIITNALCSSMLIVLFFGISFNAVDVFEQQYAQQMAWYFKSIVFIIIFFVCSWYGNWLYLGINAYLKDDFKDYQIIQKAFARVIISIVIYVSVFYFLFLTQKEKNALVVLLIICVLAGSVHKIYKKSKGI